MFPESLRRLRDGFPLTPGGVLVLGLSAVALWRFGLGRGDLVLFVVGGAGLLVGSAALLTTCIAAIVIWRLLDRAAPGAPLELEGGRVGPTGFDVAFPWFVPFVAIDWSWHAPSAEVTVERDGGRLVERVGALRRGEHEGIVRRVEVSDLLGVSRVVFRVREPRALRVLPSTGRLEQVQVVQGMAGGDALAHPTGPAVGDRMDMRSYGAGDPIRFVLWKVFARTRQLVIRTPEQALSPSRQTVAYLVAGQGDEPAAGAARVAVRCGSLGGEWTFGADGAAGTARSAAQALELVVRSGNVPPAEGAAGLRHFLETAARGPTQRAVVFVPAVPGPWLARVVDAARAMGPTGSLEFLVCTDQLERRPAVSVLKRLLFDAPASGRGAVEDLEEVVRTLGGCGGRVTVVDRAGGRAVPAAALRRSAP